MLSPNQTEPPIACTVCGTRLVGAQCPRCLLSLGSSFGLPGDEAEGDGLLDPHQVRSFGDYELLEEIVRGGMGIVYRARQISLGREVAVKMILAGELAGKESLRMFQREAHAAANLHHPNIVPVYEIGEHETQHYFTMHFVPGGKTIADWAAGRRGDHRAMAAAAARAARAVAYAHSRGVLHRDLKPSNILWDDEAGPQVTDFGLAKLLNESDGTATRAAQVIGSPSYMAPEQMGGRAAEISTATDVYGLGAVLYEMLSGQPPFSGASAIETMRRAAVEAPAPLPDVPRDLRTVCLKCLAKKQEDRYASAAALADDLERFARGEPVSAVPLTTLQTLWRWALRNPAMASLLALFVLSLIVGVTGVSWQWRQAEHARAAQGVALQKANAANAAQAAALDHLRWQEMDHWLANGEASRALAYLASLIRARPDHWQAAMFAMSIVDQQSFPVMTAEIQPLPSASPFARLSPDGKWIAFPGGDHVVRVWEAASGTEIASHAASSPVTALALGADGTLAVAREDGAITFSRRPGEPMSPLLREHRSPARGLAFSEDGSRLVSRTPNAVEIWTTASIERAPFSMKMDNGIRGLALSADGARVLVWNAKLAVVLDGDSGAELLRAESRRGFAHAAISANGRRVALADGRTGARVWDVPSRVELRGVPATLSEQGLVALDRDGTRLTLGGSGVAVAIYDVDSALRVSPPMWTWALPGGVFEDRETWRFLLPSGDGRSVAGTGGDDVMGLWDATTGRALMNPLRLSLGGNFPGISLSSDARTFLLHRRDDHGIRGSLTVWQGTRTRPSRRVFPNEPGLLGHTSLSADGRFTCIALPEPDGKRRIRIEEVAVEKIVAERTTDREVAAALFSADGARCYVVLSRETDTTIECVSLVSGATEWTSGPHRSEAPLAALSPDGTRLVVAGSSWRARDLLIFDTANGALAGRFSSEKNSTVLRFAPDRSGRFFFGNDGGIVAVADVKTGAMPWNFEGHHNVLAAAAWSPDSSRIATAAYDGVVIRDAQTGQPVGQPLEHFAALAHLDYSPDGRTLATVCWDGTLRLWDARTTQPLGPPRRQGSACFIVRFSPDGRTLLVRDTAGFRFWDVERIEPATIHFPEPFPGMGSGDCESWRAILAPDGTRIFLGTGMDHAALWTVEKPAGPAPAWFPDFLETLALMRLDAQGGASVVAGREMFSVREKIGNTADAYARWARTILRMSNDK